MMEVPAPAPIPTPTRLKEYSSAAGTVPSSRPGKHKRPDEEEDSSGHPGVFVRDSKACSLHHNVDCNYTVWSSKIRNEVA